MILPVPHQTGSKRPGLRKAGLWGPAFLLLAMAAPAAAQAPAQFEIIGSAPYCDATVVQGTNPRGASASAPQGRGVILIDPDVLADLPYLMPFVLAHECAHHVLGHTSPQGLLREGHAFRQKELDADCWAANHLAKVGEGPVVEEQIALFRDQKSDAPGPRYPAWQTRIKRMLACLDGTQPPPQPGDRD
ncbi:MAG: hypothetical protein AAGF56_15055 [Pseudomonadota bacterium]